MARHMLELLDSGESLIDSYPAPFAVWQFGDALTLVALPAEPVADYVMLLGQTLGPDKLWVSGFDNDCFGYLPTAQVVREGGHEAIGVTLWVWGQDLRRNAGFLHCGRGDNCFEYGEATRPRPLKLAATAGVLAWWLDPRDEAEWPVDVAQASRYRVLLNFAYADAAAGNEFGTLPRGGTPCREDKWNCNVT